MFDQHDEGDDAPKPEPTHGADVSRWSMSAQDFETPRGEERRAGKARRVITFAQVVVAVVQAVDAVIRLFS
ncbi:hypothetical protein [Amycolatopsis australiensis]|uniref:Uncharacterized protein n=1 Tax=Amycolatopsis australiensis TaxID=546364 RepID=A0A1K1PR98_9PSEU|nr:hypothetical protein [Amycolatopsis australiensis]SFW50258.1 hypothetical protein SAMN04489730_0931 [Amycolatopsis australiensis]